MTFEIDFPVSVLVEYVYHPLNEGVLLQFRQGHELVHTQRAGIVEIQLAETLAQPFDFIGVDWKQAHKSQI